jgi:imidazolonepropionase-like amidohydrolase
MIRARLCLAALLCAAAMMAACGAGLDETAAPPGAQESSSAGLRAFVGAQVVGIGDAQTIENATILVRDGRIEAIGPASSVRAPADARVIDLAGTFVVPGLISAHAHVSDVNGLQPRASTLENTLRQLGVFARYGITTVWSLGGEQTPAFEARAAQSSPSLDRARIYVSGPVIAAATAAEARKAVARVAAMQPDAIKIRVDDQLGTAAKMPPEVYRTVIDEAHARGLRVAVHIFYLDDAKAVLRAGADAIVHSVRDRDIDEEFIALMKTRGAAYVPTLTRELSTFVYETAPAFFADPFFLREADAAVVARLQEPGRQAVMRESVAAQRYKAGLEVAKRNLKKASDAGVLVAMGTDSGPSPERFIGYFEHLEMEMMAEAGLTPAAVLRAATADAARAMQIDDLGALTPGAWADFVALDGDPRVDIRATRAISSVWIAGNQVAR